MNRMITLLSMLSLMGLALAAERPLGGPAPTPYPFDTCIVSGEPVGDVDKPVVMTHEGREVRFCCKGCSKRFLKEPAAFLKVIDAGIAAKAAGKPAVNPAASPADGAEKK